MPRFVVRVGYEWLMPCYRDVEVHALDASDAEKKAVALSESDPEFWAESVECDGEAGSTEVFEVRRTRKRNIDERWVRVQQHFSSSLAGRSIPELSARLRLKSSKSCQHQIVKRFVQFGQWRNKDYCRVSRTGEQNPIRVRAKLPRVAHRRPAALIAS